MNSCPSAEHRVCVIEAAVHATEIEQPLVTIGSQRFAVASAADEQLIAFPSAKRLFEDAFVSATTRTFQPSSANHRDGDPFVTAADAYCFITSPFFIGLGFWSPELDNAHLRNSFANPANAPCLALSVLAAAFVASIFSFSGAWAVSVCNFAVSAAVFPICAIL